MRIAYLACASTLPGSPARQADAFEHDHMMAALRGPFAARGLTVEDVAWDDPAPAGGAGWGAYDAVIIGTTWDYWGRRDAFLRVLEGIARVTRLHNAPSLVRWNTHKAYLRDLAAVGVPTIPTRWVENATPEAVAAAFETLGSDDVVWKRQVGAGAYGQHRVRRGEEAPAMEHPMMAQPFVPAIATEGEHSFVFVGGGPSHALLKRARAGDYRIQSLYGGVEEAVDPAPADLAAAGAVMAALARARPADPPPLYARVDMVRGDEGLLLMELELVEPYLYPLQGPALGERLAEALLRDGGGRR